VLFISFYYTPHRWCGMVPTGQYRWRSTSQLWKVRSSFTRTVAWTK